MQGSFLITLLLCSLVSAKDAAEKCEVYCSALETEADKCTDTFDDPTALASCICHGPWIKGAQTCVQCLRGTEADSLAEGLYSSIQGCKAMDGTIPEPANRLPNASLGHQLSGHLTTTSTDQFPSSTADFPQTALRQSIQKHVSSSTAVPSKSKVKKSAANTVSLTFPVVLLTSLFTGALVAL